MSEDKERLTIVNAQGQALVVNKGQKVAELVSSVAPIQTIDITKTYYFDLIKTAMQVLQVN
jgi:type IV secretory pathway VirB9-like protein